MTQKMRMALAVGLAAAISGVAATLTAEQSAQTVQVRDDCDPATFNADPPVGPGIGVICGGDGDTTFGDFVADVVAQSSVDQWRFKPDEMSNARPIVAHKRGGETHTFTRVAKFADGSIAPPLNDLLGKGPEDIAPECIADATGAQNTFVPSGGDLTVKDVKGGDKFQCCIHPWMRTTVRRR